MSDYRMTEDERETLASMMPRILYLARFKLRGSGLSGERLREAIADIVCAVAIAYARKIESGSDNFTASTLVNFAFKQWRVGRRAAQSCNVNDAMSPKARLNSHGLNSETFASDRDPALIAEHKIDYEHWRATLTERQMQVCDLLAEGYRPSEVAACRGISWGRVSQVRCRLAQLWEEMFGGDV